MISNPRSGNMWLRRLLVSLYGLEERSAHTPHEVDWPALPERCVLQLHWPRTRELRRLLDRSGFEVVVLVRHPYDVLLSILQFAPHEPETARWLDGLHGDEHAILGVDPTSEAFVHYATSRRAGALLGVSTEWWDRAAFGLRYEDLVAAPAVWLAELMGALDLEPVRAPSEVTDEVSFAGLASEVRNRHFWRGQPLHWWGLIPGEVARRIAPAHDELLRRFGYPTAPDPTLTADEARSRWSELADGALRAAS